MITRKVQLDKETEFEKRIVLDSSRVFIDRSYGRWSSNKPFAYALLGAAAAIGATVWLGACASSATDGVFAAGNETASNPAIFTWEYGYGTQLDLSKPLPIPAPMPRACPHLSTGSLMAVCAPGNGLGAPLLVLQWG